MIPLVDQEVCLSTFKLKDHQGKVSDDVSIYGLEKLLQL